MTGDFRRRTAVRLTTWDGETDPALAPLRLVRPGDRLPAGKRPIMLSNSFAFGGNNGAVVLG